MKNTPFISGAMFTDQIDQENLFIFDLFSSPEPKAEGEVL